LSATRTIVLLDAATNRSEETRQIALGADLVQRDPLRTDVLVEYLARFRAAAAASAPPRADQCPISFAGAEVLPLDRIVTFRGATVKLTRREMELLDILAASPDTIVTYQMLYNDILERRFGGETSNMRVLLGKLIQSFAKVGCQLRPWIDVIPKTGYRYRSQRIPCAAPLRQLRVLKRFSPKSTA
jgi:DNA-binding response OmpR family regulator